MPLGDGVLRLAACAARMTRRIYQVIRRSHNPKGFRMTPRRTRALAILRRLQDVFIYRAGHPDMLIHRRARDVLAIGHIE
jgi:hypothetical protein